VANHWMRRLLSGTRGRLLAELRRSPATVNALTERLAISANAVRSHLAALERDGIVVLEPLQKQGVGKPAQAFPDIGAIQQVEDACDVNGGEARRRELQSGKRTSAQIDARVVLD